MNRTMDNHEIKRLEEHAKEIRKILIEMCSKKEGGII